MDQPLHEPGRYFAGIGFVAAGPQVHDAIVFVPSVVPTRAVVPVWIGVSEIALAVAEVVPPSAALAPTIVITPFALTEPDVTYFVAVNEQTVGKTALTST